MMFESWKEAVGKNKAFGVITTDLSKASDCLSHDLLIAKLHAYGNDLSSLKLLEDYLSKKKKKTKVEVLYLHGWF